MASATAPLRVSTSLADVDAPLAASLAVAVLVTEAAVIAAPNRTGSESVSIPPGAITAPATPALVAPALPDSVPHDEPALARQAAGATSAKPAGSGSAIETSIAADTPVFVTPTLYVAVFPGVYVDDASDLVALN